MADSMNPWARLKLLAPTLATLSQQSDEELSVTLRKLRLMLLAPVFAALLATMLGGWLGATLVIVALLAVALPMVLSSRIVAELTARDEARAQQAALEEAIYLEQLAREEVDQRADASEDDAPTGR
jgi:hypothetical protein